mgnify:CR=1 FL=1
MNSVIINGQHYNLVPNLQDFVKYTIQRLLETNSLSAFEVRNLQDKNYCKKIFNLNFPLLSKDRMAYSTDKSHPRYYARESFFVNGFFLCIHWFDNKKCFSKWLESLSH